MTLVLTAPHEIEMYRLLALKSMLHLETKGMKRRGRSAYILIKEEFGFKGNKENVLKQLTEHIHKLQQMELPL